MATTDAYSFSARYYDLLIGPLNSSLAKIAVRMADIAPGVRVLDVACGTGSALSEFVNRGAQATGIDVSPAMIAGAEKKLNGRARIVLGDAARMPFPDGAFDLATITLALHEMDPGEREMALAEVRRVLAPGGRILAVDYSAAAPVGLKGFLARAGTFGIEFVAGRRHFKNYRRFLASGGLPPLLAGAGFSVIRTMPLSGGNLVAVLGASGG